MNLLLIHNKYLHSGGEDSVFESEKHLLEAKGNKVITYIRSNDETNNYNLFQKLLFPLNTVFSLKTYLEVKKIMYEEKPDVVHIHNFFPLISPSIYYACGKTPIIQTLHNFRIVGGNALLLRDGKINEDALINQNPFLEVKYKTYRRSTILTFFLALMLSIHKQTFKKRISKYIAFTEFNKELFIKGGLPKTKISVKPHFVEESNFIKSNKENFAIYVGRLSAEKGIQTLIKAWNINERLEIYGTGENEVLGMFHSSKNIRLKGFLPRDEVKTRISQAKFLIFPSIWYETFGLSIIESFSVGTPVLASNLGNMKSLIKDGVTGLLFNPGDSDDLRKKAKWLFDHPKECAEMGKNAYKEYKLKYTPDTNYKMLMRIYEEAIKNARI